MANTRVQGKQHQAAGGVIDLTLSVTAGNTLVAQIVGDTTTANITSVVWDSAGDNQAFTEVGTVQRNNIHSHWMFVLASVTSTKSGVIRATQSAGFGAGMHVTEVSGTDTAAVVDNHGTNSGTSATPSMSLTTNSANSSIFAMVSNDNSFGAGSTAAGSGYTKITTGSTDDVDQFQNANSYSASEYDMDADAAGSKTVDFAFGGSSPFIIRSLAIKTAGAAAAAASTLMLMGIGT